MNLRSVAVKRASRFLCAVIALTVVAALAGCPTPDDAVPEVRTSLDERSSLNCSEGWDPLWSQGDGANSWWVEYVIDADSVSSARLEVIGGGFVELSASSGEWSGSPSSEIGTGTEVILHATNSLGQSAQTAPFGYLVEPLPLTDCVDDCTPSCDGRECGGDGCGGSCGACPSGEVCGGGFCSELPSSDGFPPGFQETVYASGLDQPTTAAFLPDGRLLVAERTGRLRVIKNGALLSTPFLSVTVSTAGERGLIGVAVDPDFASNRFLYVHYTPTGGNDPGISHISRFTASATNPDVAAPGSELILLEDIPNGFFHNSGALHFGVDGMLYFTIGDNNIRPTSPSLEAITGKIGRIDPHSYPDIIPDDNPFVGVPGARGEIWARGFRNPFTFAIDPESGRIFVNDVGDADWEEINEVTKGANYGWPRCEGSNLLLSDAPCADAALTNPLYAYPHEPNGGLSGCSIIGGAFYRGNQFPAEYDGSYFFVDYCGNWIARRTPAGDIRVFTSDAPQSLITTILTGPDGSLYYVNNGNGNVYRVDYVGNGNRAPIADASASPTSGAAPLDVSFDGRDSSDPDGDSLSYAWSFGDGTSASGAVVNHRYASTGSFEAVLTVRDGNGGTDSETLTVSVGGAPRASIGAPASGARYDAGDSVSYSGTAVRADGSPLPASAFSWTVIFHHDEHTHPFLGPIDDVTSGSFTIPTIGEIAADVFYRVHLTVTDGALTHRMSRDVLPNTATISLETVPAGLALNLDEGSVSAPHSVVGVTGIVRTLSAPSPQLVGGSWYEFSSWSDGGARSHAISTASADTTYTAVFDEVSDPGESGDVILYDDTLHWNDWSWSTSTANVSSPVRSGSAALAVSFGGPWAGLSLERDAFDTGAYEQLRFFLRPNGAALPALVAWFHLPGGGATPKVDVRPYASSVGGGWVLVEVPLLDLDADNTTVTRFTLQDASGSTQPTFHLDQLSLSAGGSAPPPPPPPAGPSFTVYDDELHWDDWSWGALVDPSATSSVLAGERALALTYTQAWGGLSLRDDGFDTSPYTHLVMALHPGSASLPRLLVSVYDSGDAILEEIEARPFSTPTEGGWHLVSIPLSALGAENTTLTRVQLQDGTGGTLPTLYLDDLGFSSP